MGSLLSRLILPPGHPDRRSPNLSIGYIIKKVISFAIWAFGVAGVANFLSYYLPLIYARFARTPNLLQKYSKSLSSLSSSNDEPEEQWALVTGASTGLGKSLTCLLAEQGFHIVYVALDNQFFIPSLEQLRKKYPNTKFRAIACDLSFSSFSSSSFSAPLPTNDIWTVESNCDYLPAIIDATKDIHVSVVINNAGYIVMGAFHSVKMKPQLANIGCQVLAPVRIADYFYKKLVKNKRKGAICFTSSPGGFFPSPLGTSYAGSKSYLSAFSAALACEARHFGIDVCCMHPSFMIGSNFTTQLPKIQLWKQLASIGQTPNTVARNFINSIGRLTWTDSGLFSISQRSLLKLFHMNVWIPLISMSIARNPDTRDMLLNS